MRKIPRLLVAALVAVIPLMGGLSVAAAQDDPVDSVDPVTSDGPTDEVPEGALIDVVQVSGLLDPIVVDFLRRQVEGLEPETLALIIQLNSPGSVVGDEELLDLLETIDEAPVPVGVWVGPSSSARGKAAYLLAAADLTAVGPGGRVGDLGPRLTGEPDDILGPNTTVLRNRTVDRQEARDLEIADTGDESVGEFVLGMVDNELIPDVTRQVTRDDGLILREPAVPVRFAKPGLFDQFMHTVASPAIAYLLLLAGLGLLVLELYTAGVGVAGVVGAGCFALAGYGLDVLPARWWAVALLVISALGYAIDVQTGVPRFWTGAATVMLIVGSLWLFDGVSLAWTTLLAGMVGTVLLYVTAMPSLTRTRFGTTTIGRSWMLDEMGEAATDIDPDGTVRMREALWRARTNRATPITAGERVKVVALDGHILEVEPEEGAAVDYREQRRRRRTETPTDTSP